MSLQDILTEHPGRRVPATEHVFQSIQNSTSDWDENYSQLGNETASVCVLQLAEATSFLFI